MKKRRDPAASRRTDPQASAAGNGNQCPPRGGELHRPPRVTSSRRGRTAVGRV